MSAIYAVIITAAAPFIPSLVFTTNRNSTYTMILAAWPLSPLVVP